MRVCILETDRPEGELVSPRGTYADMFERWLGPALPEAAFSRIFVAGGASLPNDPGEYDAFLITGARAGVYDDKPWIAPLIDFLRPVRAARVPTAGSASGTRSWRRPTAARPANPIGAGS